MRLLLDTHIALLAVTDSRRLPTRARELLLTPENSLFVSAASVWEISIKRRIAPAKMPVSGAQALGLFKRSNYFLVSVTAEHAAAVDDLPAHHADPFDRILVAQALREPLRLVTADEVMARYSDTVIVT